MSKEEENHAPNAPNMEVEDDGMDDFGDIFDEIDQGISERRAQDALKEKERGGSKLEEEEEEEEAEDEEGEKEREDAELLRQKEEEEARILKKKRVSTRHLSREQRQRYTAYRLSKLDRNTIKRVINRRPQVTNKAYGSIMLVMLGAAAKLYVGDLVEYGMMLKEEWGDEGALRPIHIREAFRRLKEEGKVKTAIDKNRIGKRF